MPIAGIADCLAPVASHMWLARPTMTLPLLPQSCPTAPGRFGSCPCAFIETSSLLVPTLPAAKKTWSAVTVLVPTVLPCSLIWFITTCSRRRSRPAQPRSPTCSAEIVSLPVAAAAAR